MAHKHPAFGLAAVAVTLLVLAPAHAASGSTNSDVRVTVTTVQSTVAAPGVLRWTVRITNLGSKPLAHLSFAEEVSLAGDPGHGGTQPFAAGSCGAAAGTSYCPLPTLLPGQTISRDGSATVVARLAPQGPSTIGSRVETLEFVSTADGAIVSNQARLAVSIVRAGLPGTGDATGALAFLGLCCLVAGAVSSVIGAGGGAETPRG